MSTDRIYRLQPTDPDDARTIATFAPEPLTLRGACGVSIDLARHLHAPARIVRTDGVACRGLVETEMDVLRKHRAGEMKVAAG